MMVIRAAVNQLNETERGQRDKDTEGERERTHGLFEQLNPHTHTHTIQEMRIQNQTTHIWSTEGRERQTETERNRE